MHPAGAMTLEFPTGIFRCGASGTKMHQDIDRVYGAENAKSSGLNSRLRLYESFLLPLKMTIHAALRVKRQLVANVDKHRTMTDFAGNEVNQTSGSYTLVLHREFQFHEALDKKDYRYKPGTKKELFVPDTNVEDLIRVLRTIKGEQLYLFTENDYEIDTTYRGGKERATKVIETKRRETHERAKKGIRLPQITLR